MSKRKRNNLRSVQGNLKAKEKNGKIKFYNEEIKIDNEKTSEVNEKIKQNDEKIKLKLNIQEIKEDFIELIENEPELIDDKNDFVDWKNKKQLFKNFIFGFLCACSDLLPGYSGATTLSNVGFYQKFIINFKSIFSSSNKRNFWKYLLWCLPFIISGIGVLIGLLYAVNAINEAGSGIILVFLFISISFFSIPVFYLKNRKMMKDDFNFKNKNWSGSRKIKIILFAGAFITMIIIAILIKTLIKTTSPTGEVYLGITFLIDKHNIKASDLSDIAIIVKYLAAGFIAGFVTLIPGLSGSLIIFLFGIYKELAYAMSQIPVNPDFVPIVIVTGLGIISGFIFSAFAINIILKNWKSYFQSFSFGLIASSFLVIAISLSINDYWTLSQPINIGLGILMLFIGFLLNILVLVYLQLSKQINLNCSFLSKISLLSKK